MLMKKGAKRNFEPWRDQSKMEEVNEATEKRLHRREVEEAQQEEMELRERNTMEQLEEKMMDSKRGRTLQMRRTKSGYEMPRWEDVGLVE